MPLFQRLRALAQAAKAIEHTLVISGLTRSYRLYVPGKGRAGRWPLVLALHGGGSDGLGMERLTGLSLLADQAGFIVAYPDGIGKNWNDGRWLPSSRAHRENVDDVGFINALLDLLAKEYPIDLARIYVTGISNGGIFAHLLGARLSPRIAAIAPVVGGIVERTLEQFNPTEPVSVFIMQGTADPIVPFAGGEVEPGQRGRIIPTDRAAALWVEKNGCTLQSASAYLPDTDPNDGCRVQATRWSGGRGGSEVLYYKIEGGGHTWPGGAQYLPKRLIGPVCHDFEASEAIWEFFEKHPKQAHT